MFAIFVAAALTLQGLVGSATASPAQGWDYRKNGADWSSGQCGQGGAQSPVNLPMEAPAAEEELSLFLKYPKLDSAFTVYNNANSIAFTLPETFRGGFGVGPASDGAEAFQTESGESYRLWQVNFHSPSEHTIDGRRLPLEMQMMHQRVTGGEGLAVVVVLFDAVPNAYGELLDSIIGKSLPETPWQEAVRKPPVEFAKVLGGSPYYSYEGSLTVPPCEQQVKYFVRKETVPAAMSQLLAFSKVLEENHKPKGNYRLTQPLRSPLLVMGSVDLVDNPDKMIKPSTPSTAAGTVAQAQAETSMAACGSSFFDDATQNIDRVTTTDPTYLSSQKIKYNSAMRDYQAGQNAIGDTARNRKMLQNLYDNTPGPVEKIHVKWQLQAAEQLVADAITSLPEKKKYKDQEYAIIVEMLHRQCSDMLAAKRAAAAKKAKAEAEAPPPKRKQLSRKAVKRLSYSKPNLKLPTGLGGSPFSKKEPDGTKVVLSEKIAVNLAQPDAPPSATVDTAEGDDTTAKENKGSPNKILHLKLPISKDKIDVKKFSDSLVKALAKAGQIPESRLEIQEIRKTDVKQVRSAGAPALIQEHSHDYPRRSLRHVTAI